MRMTKRTSLAMRVLMYCAVNQGQNVTKAQIAAACDASENHLGHVVNKLGRIGYLTTYRGRHGGMRLAMPAQAISVGEDFRRFEAGVPVAECLAGGPNFCPLAPACRLSSHICGAVEAFFAHLDGIMLSDLVETNTPMHDLLHHGAAA